MDRALFMVATGRNRRTWPMRRYRHVVPVPQASSVLPTWYTAMSSKAAKGKTAAPRDEAESGSSPVHRMRITSGGSIQAYVAFALKHLEVRLPLPFRA